MAKQFSILATRVDLERLETILRQTTPAIELLSDEPTEDLAELKKLESLAIPLSEMGKASLVCCLAPRDLQRRIKMERLSEVKVDLGGTLIMWRTTPPGATSC